MRSAIVRNFSRGFTLIELLVTIAVIVILAGIAYPTYTTMIERARVTQDLSNLRQIGLATQLYLNDNDGVLFTAGGIWMAQLHPKYLPAWKIFQSPFDYPPPPARTASEDGTSSPISYGLNGNPGSAGLGSSIAGLSMDKVANPSAFIVFAPAPDTTVGSVPKFQGVPAAAVTEYKGTSAPGGLAPTPGGTHNQRKRINALFADLHAENILWSTFVNDTNSATDPSASQRWTPYTGY
jgi:prepilin-type N-terminal cleavage/methylation domain-containing protein/prepilin-type processing-associated H-X9-DG protein